MPEYRSTRATACDRSTTRPSGKGPPRARQGASWPRAAPASRQEVPSCPSMARTQSGGRAGRPSRISWTVVQSATLPCVTTAADRVSRRQVDKFEERRRQLADGALQTLSERGYARTSLREIAQNTEFSHGTLHYYFRDKVELIMYCVRRYKAVCVQRYDTIVSDSDSAEGLAADFAEGLVTTCRDDALMHRLWYDLRSQSLFEESFRPDVAEIDESLERMIWRIVSRYAELAGQEPTCSSAMAYATFDGLFQQALLRHLSGSALALDDLRAGARHLLGHVVCA
jgi:AcrR family transcriptional regulator